MSLQLHQSLNLLLLLIIATLTANVYLLWVDIVFILLFTLFIEHLFLYFNSSRTFYFSYASLSTAVGVVVLIYASALWTYFFIITLGLAEKHFLLLRDRHLFNPSNFALMIGLVFFYDDAHLIAGQFGDDVLLSMLVLVLALSILVRVGRVLIPITFLLFYFSLQYLFIVSYDPVMIFEHIYHRLYSVTFMLFIYFMLTDPAVTPQKWYGQVLFTFCIALLATLLDRFYGFRVQHLFMVLFFLSPFVHISTLKNFRLEEIKLIVIILFMMIGSLVYVETQAPYYFEMNG